MHKVQAGRILQVCAVLNKARSDLQLDGPASEGIGHACMLLLLWQLQAWHVECSGCYLPCQSHCDACKPVLSTEEQRLFLVALQCAAGPMLVLLWYLDGNTSMIMSVLMRLALGQKKPMS